MSKTSSHLNPKSTVNILVQNSTPPTIIPIKTSYIKTVSSTSTSKSQQPISNKKGKGKVKQNFPQHEKNKTQPAKET